MLFMALLNVPNTSLAQDSELRAAQTFLLGRGYSPGPADGFIGPRTRSALRQFQQDRDIPVTGLLEEATLREIRLIQRSFTETVEFTPKNQTQENTSASNEESILILQGFREVDFNLPQIVNEEPNSAIILHQVPPPDQLRSSTLVTDGNQVTQTEMSVELIELTPEMTSNTSMDIRPETVAVSGEEKVNDVVQGPSIRTGALLWFAGVFAILWSMVRRRKHARDNGLTHTAVATDRKKYDSKNEDMTLNTVSLRGNKYSLPYGRDEGRQLPDTMALNTEMPNTWDLAAALKHNGPGTPKVENPNVTNPPVDLGEKAKIAREKRDQHASDRLHHLEVSASKNRSLYSQKADLKMARKVLEARRRVDALGKVDALHLSGGLERDFWEKIDIWKSKEILLTERRLQLESWVNPGEILTPTPTLASEDTAPNYRSDRENEHIERTDGTFLALNAQTFDFKKLMSEINTLPPLEDIPTTHDIETKSEALDSDLTFDGKTKTSQFISQRHKRKSGWVPRNESATVSDHEIGGMIYIGAAPRTTRYGKSCGAYINPALSVASKGNVLGDGAMPYWPNYSELTPTCRATYLDWLASGRSNFECDIGYMFLYFYGLERRFMLDDIDETEQLDILNEVVRLHGIFTQNYSANNYLSKFIDVARVVLYSGEAIDPILSHSGFEFPLSLSIELGQMIANEERLNADWVLSWLICTPGSRLRTPAHRCEAEFRELFRLKFDTQYPEGMKVRRPKKQLSAVYQAASGEFTCDLTPMSDGAPIPDISSIRKPVIDAQKIADSAMVELDKFSRYLGRNPNGRGTMEAHALLPSDLWPIFPSAELEQLEQWAKAIVQLGGIVPVIDVIEKLEGTQPSKISKRQLTGAADALAKLGLGLAPDPRFALRSPKLEESVVLFELPEGVMQLEDVSSAYHLALMELGLGTFIAQADGKVVPSEEAALWQVAETAIGLTPSESVRLSANLTWMLTTPPDINVFRKRLLDASEEQRIAFRKVVVAMALADLVIRPEEIDGIEKIYKTLGLDPASVYADVHSAAMLDEPIKVQEFVDETTGELITESLLTSGNLPVLDAARIAEIKSDTLRISDVLGKIFSTDEALENDESYEDNKFDTQFEGLDPKHSAFAAELIGRENWSEDDFKQLASRYELMVLGCLEIINEWALKHFDDMLIEEYNGYEVNPDVIQVLNEMNWRGQGNGYN